MDPLNPSFHRDDPRWTTKMQHTPQNNANHQGSYAHRITHAA
jgi:hypothetical protein